MSPNNLKHTLIGAVKSFTVWFAALIALLPEALPLVQANFATVAPFIPPQHQARALQLVALVMLVLRLKTNSSLADKGRPQEPPK